METKVESEKMKELVLGLIIKEGLSAALIILENMQKVTTIDDAINALKKTQTQVWAAFKEAPQS